MVGRKQSSDCNNLINFVVVLIVYRQHLRKYDCIKCWQEDWISNFVRNKIQGGFIFYKFGIVLREYYLSCHNMNPLLHYKVSNLTSSIIHQISNQLILRKLIERTAKIDHLIFGRINMVAIVFFEGKTFYQNFLSMSAVQKPSFSSKLIELYKSMNRLVILWHKIVMKILI